MNRKFGFALLVFFCFAAGGCQKLLDYYNNGSSFDRSDTCRVLSITDRLEDSTVFHTAIITYNNDGTPATVTHHYITESGEYEDVDPYEYDEQGRLVKHGPFSTPSPYYRKYVYEGDSRLPVRDTLYSIANIYVEEFGYDEQGRIISEFRRRVFQPGDEEPIEPDEEKKYYYDLRGNRQEDPSNTGYPGLIVYSENPSLYSLNRVWQVEYRDFSRNATRMGETFNRADLPLTIKRGYDGYFQPFLRMSGGAEIVYECK